MIMIFLYQLSRYLYHNITIQYVITIVSPNNKLHYLSSNFTTPKSRIYNIEGEFSYYEHLSCIILLVVHGSHLNYTIAISLFISIEQNS